METYNPNTHFHVNWKLLPPTSLSHRHRENEGPLKTFHFYATTGMRGARLYIWASDIPRTHFVCAYMCAWVCACMCASPFLCVCARCVCDRVHPSPHVLHLYSTCHGHVEMGAAVFSYCGQGTNVVCGAVKHRKIDLIKNVVPCYSPKFSLWSLPN
jgi:hypothetical protein